MNIHIYVCINQPNSIALNGFLFGLLDPIYDDSHQIPLWLLHSNPNQSISYLFSISINDAILENWRVSQVVF